MRRSLLPLLLCAGALLTACTPQSPLTWWHHVNAKATEILRIEAEYAALKKEHEALSADYYKLENEYMSLLAESETRKEAQENLRVTGSKTGRIPSNINYKMPEDMEPEQKLKIAFEHLREKRYAQAAAAFDSFLWVPEGAPFQTANAFYSSGVAWYQLENYKQARKCFSESAQRADSDERAKITHKVDLWMRVLDHKLGKESKDGKEKAHGA